MVTGSAVMYSRRLEEILARLRVKPTDGPALGHLLNLRHEVARIFLGAPTAQLESLYRSEIGQVHDTLLSIGVAGYPAQAHERATIDPVIRQLTQGVVDHAAVNRVLAVMLYEGPHRTLTCEVLSAMPPWFSDLFLKYALGLPWLFREKGEVELYYRHLIRWVDYLHANILGNRASAYWQEIARGFARHSTFLTLYFTWSNLRDIYRKRAELIEFELELRGARLDCALGPRPDGSSRIRLGVLAPNFSPRAETFATLPVYAHLDRKRFEVILIVPSVREKSPLDHYCASRADRVLEFPDDDLQAVETVRALDLDMVWIGANVATGRDRIAYLSAHRLARVQIAGACAPVTTGLRNVDVFVSGDLTEPSENAQDHYTEKLVCMEGPAHCFDFGPDGEQAATQIYDRARLRIPEKDVVYASGANYFKITPELEETWVKILAGAPHSRLLLYPFNPNWAKSYPASPLLYRLLATCKRFGVDGNRVLIIPPLPAVADVRALLKSADVYLDSFPHSGMTSLIDPLSVGVPTVALEGNSQRSRMASAALRDLGMPQLIASDQEAYQKLAVRLGKDRALRRQYAEQIRQKLAKPPKFLDPRWCSGEAARVFMQLANSNIFSGPAAQRQTS